MDAATLRLWSPRCIATGKWRTKGAHMADDMADNRAEGEQRAAISDKEALLFHSRGRPGKLAVVASKPMATQRDLSLAYSPGVAAPVLAIAKDPSAAFDYTTRGNMVAVITNGTAILGLGDLGALAAKPVMEGKAALFKRFADIDSIDLEIDAKEVDDFVNAVRYLGPSFGGINLEDIKAPECFVIEERLRDLMDIPVFHDDQHGTAIISAAGMLNALLLTGRDIRTAKLVCNGAGAAGIACLDLAKALGFDPRNMILCDTKGVVYRGRQEGMNQWKSAHAIDTKARTLAEALEGADIFYGLSVKGALTPKMLLSMADNPIVFAMANPDPEITPEEARATRADVIIATGRSDYPNQINNVLGFPYIFRGALDVRAQDDQHGDEDCRHTGARRARAGGRARRSGERLSRRASPFWPRLSHSGAVRSASDLSYSACHSARSDGHRRRAPADRGHEGLSRRAFGAPRSDRRADADGS